MEKSMRDELLERHPDYIENMKDWNFYGKSYEGGKAFIDLVIKQHTRESNENFQKRKGDAIYVNFSKEIIDIFNFYLTEKPVLRQLGKLDKDNLWSKFKDDCDLEGTDFNVYMNQIETLAAIHGSVGILVDKPKGKKDQPVLTRQDEINAGIYPYCSTYSRPNVWDWKYVRNRETGRRELVYLKLVEEDGDITRWYLDHWERWRFPIDEQGKELDPIKVDSGPNAIGTISFVWLENVDHTSKKDIGISDIVEISRVGASITRNFSHGEEVIEWAAFPIFLEPKEPDDLSGSGGDQVEIGVQAVKEFDPENPQAKPSWLEAAVIDPITAVNQWIDKKIDLIFQMAHLSGVHSVEKSKEARSAVALRLQFNQLWSVLSKKAENLNETELKIIYYWLLWQNNQDLYPQVKVSRSKDFSVDDLSQSLYNLKESMKMVLSVKYNKLVQKQIVKTVMPDITPNEVEEIHKEIETNQDKISVVQDLGLKDSRQTGLGKPEVGGPAEIPDVDDQIKQGA